METFLGITRTEMDLDSLWGNSSLSTSHGSLETMLFATYPTLITMDQTRLLAEPFMTEYATANRGRKPFIDPVPLSRWEYGWSQPADAYEDQFANKTTFMNWFGSEVVVGGDPDSCSGSILIYPQSSGKTTYRNAYTGCGVLPCRRCGLACQSIAMTVHPVRPLGSASNGPLYSPRRRTWSYQVRFVLYVTEYGMADVSRFSTCDSWRVGLQFDNHWNDRVPPGDPQLHCCKRLCRYNGIPFKCDP